MMEINEALVLGSVRQHGLTNATEALNARLELEITKRKRAQDSLRISEVRYRRLFKGVSDGVLLLDPHTFQITAANPFMTQMLGLISDAFVFLWLHIDVTPSRWILDGEKSDFQRI